MVSVGKMQKKEQKQEQRSSSRRSRSKEQRQPEKQKKEQKQQKKDLKRRRQNVEDQSDEDQSDEDSNLALALSLSLLEVQQDTARGSSFGNGDVPGSDMSFDRDGRSGGECCGSTEDVSHQSALATAAAAERRQECNEARGIGSMARTDDAANEEIAALKQEDTESDVGMSNAAQSQDNGAGVGEMHEVDMVHAQENNGAPSNETPDSSDMQEKDDAANEEIAALKQGDAGNEEIAALKQEDDAAKNEIAALKREMQELKHKQQKKDDAANEEIAALEPQDDAAKNEIAAVQF